MRCPNFILIDIVNTRYDKSGTKAIWRDIGKQFGSPPKDSEEYYRKVEVYQQILEELNQAPPPPPHRMPVRIQREESEQEVPRLQGCCCACHVSGRVPLAQPRRRVVRCDGSESEGEFGDVRLARRGRRVILTSDDESDSESDSDDEPVRKRPVGRPSKKSTAVQKKKVEKEKEKEKEKEEKKKKKTAAEPSNKKKQAKVSRS